ncbi:hypothetical protein Trydic_g23550 [Trypoxylus dichotomus]
MALRIANKISRHIAQNVSRSLSAKRDTDLEPTIQKAEDASKPVEQSPPLSTPTMPIVYEVCRPRTTPITPFPNTVQNESDAVRKTMALQHLQPSMLPEYYKPPVEINSACMGFDNVSESVAKYRKFEESNTFKNITLPLKMPKLASPFPEPVKVMPSHTVSDQEKAEQMLAESKAIKNTSTKATASIQTPLGPMSTTRNYTTGSAAGANSKDKKCKLGGVKEKKKCTKIKVPFCAPVKSFKCGKRKKKTAQCVKKPPPYPSYSETCHEDPYNKPSECKICPYKADEHPTFKPSKNSFHTFSSLLGKTSTSKIRVKANVIRKKDAHTEAKSRPTPTQDKKEAEKAKEIAVAAPPKPSHPSTISLGKEMGSWLDRLQPEDVILPVINRMYEMNASEEGVGGKCKKFPFKECTFTIVKERKPAIAQTRKCPEKEKPKLVKDCPSDKTENCKKKTSAINETIFYAMTDKDGKGGKDEKKKCPKVNLGICQDPREITDDPCHRKRRGKTMICPNDLLKKGPRHKDKKKKTSGVISPLGEIASPHKSETTINV